MLIENLKEMIRENKGKCIAIVIILLFVMLMINCTNHEKDENKIFKNNKYVFTYETEEILEKKSELPYINLDGEIINEINKELMAVYYKNNILQEQYMTYNFYVNNDILSLIVQLYNIESDDFIANEMYFYNIDINKKRLIYNDDLKEIYDVSDDYIENKILEQVKQYYDYEVKNDYITDCDFNCYKGYFDNNILDNINYFVKEDGLYAYRYFPVDYMFAYDTKKTFDTYYFKIK